MSKSIPNAYCVTDDPMVQFVIEEFMKLKMQNKRYEKQIRDSSNLLKVKTIENWQAKDFFNYFCEKFSEKYSKEYRLSGSMGVAINKIDKFILDHNLVKEDYKRFIDIAFGRYFNASSIPMLGHICSWGLYERLMGKAQRMYTANDVYNLDAKIAKESESFEQDILNMRNMYASKRK